MKVHQYLEIFLLVAGVLGIGLWLWAYLERSAYQESAERAFDEQAGRPQIPAAQKPRSPGGQSLIGRLSIPRLDMSAMVREGTEEATLRVALGHIPGTALPGSLGNVGVAGHRDTWFRVLRGIHNGDVIRFETQGQMYVYRVESTRVVQPQEVDVLRAGQEPELTLVTCYPFYYVGTAPRRFIVKARQVGPEARSIAAAAGAR